MSTVDGSIFEGLFLRVLKPEGAFKSQLRGAGFDVDRPQGRYPEDVFGRALTVTTAYAFGREDITMAHRRIGHALIEGYFMTILGKMTGGLIPVLGLGGTLKKVAQLWKVPQPGMEISAAAEGRGQWVVHFRDRVMTADLVAGILEAALRRADPLVQVEVVARRLGAGVVRVKTGAN
ncbi:MAG: DUF2378 family protein [Archangium sp.]|nr:DUF2378 family protein [Archangium sp.]MDP3152645.1 DUF2378 family protein [Archangium sp.]MDP3575137.1 DUF2378 family protein [Archangium sp.]